MNEQSKVRNQEIKNKGLKNKEAENGRVDYKWQCRRGMLELDLLLNNFVDKGVDALSEKEIESFELLLSYPDQTLLDLLLGNSISSNNEISSLVQKIQKIPLYSSEKA